MKYQQILVAFILALAAFAAHAAQTSYFIYDESGHVIGEYDANGNPIQEHIYLGDKPVAVVQSGNTATMDYVTTDQLDTPRIITDSGQNVVWQWNSDPYGNGQPTGSLTYNLRFPGQYYDAETAHNYNIFRDYDSGTGRYTESDPIGIRRGLGGLNTYTYVRDNPLMLFDRLGLCPNACQQKCIDAYNKEHDDSLRDFNNETQDCNMGDPKDYTGCSLSAISGEATLLYLARKKRDKCLAGCGT